MAVYKRTYRGYNGPLTPAWSRFVVLTRYAQRGLFRSKFLTALFALCFFYPLGCALALYLNHNLTVLSYLHVRERNLLDVNGNFFLTFLGAQGMMAFLLTAFIGPGLISPDLANGALPLYFYRPLSRAEYILGKMGVTLWLLSLITWAPGLILFAIEGSLSGASWTWANLYLAWGVLAGSCIWILVISLIALALSAWVKWRIVAGALVLGVMFIGSGFGQAINVVLRTDIGWYIDPLNLAAKVWAGLLRVENTRITVPPAGALVALLAMCGVCLWLLARKVRAFETVR